MRPSERKARNYWLRAAVALAALEICLAAFAPRATSARDDPRAGQTLMKELSDRFRALEKGLAEHDADDIAQATAQLRELAPRLGQLKPQINREYADDFERRAGRFGELVTEIADLNAQSRFDGSAQAFQELRATCVSCHVSFRASNAERGDHPAVANTITGTVDLRDADGKAREDRSWVLVFLESTQAPAPVPNLRQDPRVSQSGREFHPRVLPVTVGTRVQFPNDDTIFHNVFSLSKAAPFDLGIYEPGNSASVLMTRTGLVKVYCNIHPEMAASIVVLANPWFALTDRSGRFVVCGVPDGEYALRAWNDMGAESRQAISVTGGRVHEANIQLAETSRVFAHNNKYGKPYTDKYR